MESVFKLSIVLCTVILVYAEAVNEKFRCDYTYDSTVDVWFKLQTIPSSWTDARLRCHLEGSDLASPLSKSLAQRLRNFLKSKGYKNFDWLWSGVHDWNEHGEWLTIEGQTLEDAGFDSFGAGEPNNMTKNEFCGAMRRDGYLNDLICDAVHPFICEKDPNRLNICAIK